jgi:hypothetical protein
MRVTYSLFYLPARHSPPFHLRNVVSRITSPINVMNLLAITSNWTTVFHDSLLLFWPHLDLPERKSAFIGTIKMIKRINKIQFKRTNAERRTAYLFFTGWRGHWLSKR